jgi:uracil phosphoribosyltransferase
LKRRLLVCVSWKRPMTHALTKRNMVAMSAPASQTRMGCLRISPQLMQACRARLSVQQPALGVMRVTQACRATQMTMVRLCTIPVLRPALGVMCVTQACRATQMTMVRLCIIPGLRPAQGVTCVTQACRATQMTTVRLCTIPVLRPALGVMCAMLHECNH